MLWENPPAGTASDVPLNLRPIECLGPALAAGRQRLVTAVEEVDPGEPLTRVVGAVIAIAITVRVGVRDGFVDRAGRGLHDPGDMVTAGTVDAQEDRRVPAMGHRIELASGLVLAVGQIRCVGAHLPTVGPDARLKTGMTGHRSSGSRLLRAVRPMPA